MSMSFGLLPSASGDTNDSVPKFVAGLMVPSAIMQRIPDGPVFVKVDPEIVPGLAICSAEAESTVAEIGMPGGVRLGVGITLVIAAKSLALSVTDRAVGGLASGGGALETRQPLRSSWVSGGALEARRPLRSSRVFGGTYANVGGIPALGRGRGLSLSFRGGGSRGHQTRLLARWKIRHRASYCFCGSAYFFNTASAIGSPSLGDWRTRNS